MAVLDHYLVVIDGFTLKFWTREGQYLGTLNSSKVLGDNLNCAKLVPSTGTPWGSWPSSGMPRPGWWRSGSLH